jgi:hypothetical protein
MVLQPLSATVACELCARTGRECVVATGGTACTECRRRHKSCSLTGGRKGKSRAESAQAPQRLVVRVPGRAQRTPAPVPEGEGEEEREVEGGEEGDDEEDGECEVEGGEEETGEEEEREGSPMAVDAPPRSVSNTPRASGVANRDAPAASTQVLVPASSPVAGPSTGPFLPSPAPATRLLVPEQVARSVSGSSRSDADSSASRKRPRLSEAASVLLETESTLEDVLNRVVEERLLVRARIAEMSREHERVMTELRDLESVAARLRQGAKAWEEGIETMRDTLQGLEAVERIVRRGL